MWNYGKWEIPTVWYCGSGASEVQIVLMEQVKDLPKETFIEIKRNLDNQEYSKKDVMIFFAVCDLKDEEEKNFIIGKGKYFKELGVLAIGIFPENVYEKTLDETFDVSILVPAKKDGAFPLSKYAVKVFKSIYNTYTGFHLMDVDWSFLCKILKNGGKAAIGYSEGAKDKMELQKEVAMQISEIFPFSNANKVFLQINDGEITMMDISELDEYFNNSSHKTAEVVIDVSVNSNDIKSLTIIATSK